MSNAERQRAYKARQREDGKRSVMLWLTPDEQYYLERTLMQMRREESTPALMRLKNGTLSALDV